MDGVVHNSIIAGFEARPPEICPSWNVIHYRNREYDDAEGWAFGFLEGMDLCAKDWKPLLATPEGKAWFRPIGLLAKDGFSEDQEMLTRTPAQRAKIAKMIPDALEAMHAFWLPYRMAAHERKVGNAMAAKTGRNEPCPCGSGKKFKRCCGAAGNLH